MLERLRKIIGAFEGVLTSCFFTLPLGTVLVCLALLIAPYITAQLRFGNFTK